MPCSMILLKVIKFKVYFFIFVHAGLEPGTVVISEAAVDGILRPYMEVVCNDSYTTQNIRSIDIIDI